ncbi:Nuclear receptor [Aphelenchoides fujianensis]|nr:Nuclear receptor [Aphelenchoides fujianensis]
MPPITSAAMSCLVCSETPASKHYGSYSCSGCKGFFRRSVRQHRVYYCSYNNDCVIRKEFRNCCRACRMQKCLMIGMSPKLVHSDRGALGKAKQFERPGDSPVDLPSDFSPTSTTFNFNLQQMAPDSTSALRASGLALSPGSCSSIDAPPFAFNPQLAGMAGWFPQWQQARDTSLFINSSATMLETDQGPLGVRQWIPLFDRSNADQVVTYFLQVDKMLDQFAEFEHNHVFSPDNVYPVNMNIDLQRAFLEPRALMGRSKIDWSTAYPVNGGLHRIWLRVGMYYLDWISHIPELNRLSLEDRLRLTAGRSMACIWAVVAQRSASALEKKGVVLSGGVYYPIDQSVEKTIDATLSPFDSSIVKFMGNLSHFLWNDVVEQIRRLKITDAEMVLLRVLCWLSGVPCMSKEGREIAREGYSFYMNVLFKVVQEVVGAPEKVPGRLCELMALLPSFEKAANLQDDGFSMMALSDLAGLGSNVIADYHLRRSFRI